MTNGPLSGGSAGTGSGMTRARLYRIVLAFSLLGYGWIGWSLSADRAADSGALSTPCLFKLATGFPCPSCGTTRAVEALAAGDPAGSLMANPFGLPVALGALIIPPWILIDIARSRDGFLRFYLSLERTLTLRRAPAIACVALVLANWGWNFAKGF